MDHADGHRRVSPATLNPKPSFACGKDAVVSASAALGITDPISAKCEGVEVARFHRLGVAGAVWPATDLAVVPLSLE